MLIDSMTLSHILLFHKLIVTIWVTAKLIKVLRQTHYHVFQRNVSSTFYKWTYHNYFHRIHPYNLFHRCRIDHVQCNYHHRKPKIHLDKVVHQCKVMASPCVLCSWVCNFLQHLSNHMSAFQCRKIDRLDSE